MLLHKPKLNSIFQFCAEITVCAPEPQATQSVDIVEEEPRHIKRKMGATKHNGFKKMPTKKSSKRSKVEH